MDAKYKEMEDKCHVLQGQLTEAYRKNSENVEKMLLATQKEAEALKLKERLNEMSATVERMTREMNEKDVSLTALRDEVHAVQARLVEKEKKLKDTEEENSVLIERWLSYKNLEAESMNQKNQLVEHQKEAEQKRAEELKEKGRQIMENKGKTSMLDSASGTMGAFVTVKLPSRARKEFTAHQGEANCVAFAQSGTKFCTGGADMRIKVWDARTGGLLSQLSGSVGSVMDAKWSANELYVLGAACDNIARVWDINLGRLKHTLTGHIGKVYAGVFTADSMKVVTGAHDRTVKVWDMGTGNTLKTIFCYSSCNDVAVSDSYACIASAHLDGTLRLWDIRTGDSTHEMKGAHSKQITSVSVSPSNHALLTCGRDNLLKVWDFRMNECIKTLQDDAFRSGLNWSRACWSPDAKYVAAGGAEGSLFVWDVEKGTLEKELGSDSNATISCVAWNPNGMQLASTDRKARCILWE
jgi:autophagy-related protein 16